MMSGRKQKIKQAKKVACKEIMAAIPCWHERILAT